MDVNSQSNYALGTRNSRSSSPAATAATFWETIRISSVKPTVGFLPNPARPSFCSKLFASALMKIVKPMEPRGRPGPGLTRQLFPGAAQFRIPGTASKENDPAPKAVLNLRFSNLEPTPGRSDLCWPPCPGEAITYSPATCAHVLSTPHAFVSARKEVDWTLSRAYPRSMLEQTANFHRTRSRDLDDLTLPGNLT